MNNSEIIQKVVDITVAKVTNTNLSATSLSGSTITAFMQEVYDKLVELNSNN